MGVDVDLAFARADLLTRERAEEHATAEREEPAPVESAVTPVHRRLRPWLFLDDDRSFAAADLVPGERAEECATAERQEPASIHPVEVHRAYLRTIVVIS
jgi:hypothetical protein